jgi:hypothetical protein
VISSEPYVRDCLASFAYAWVGSIQFVEDSEVLKSGRKEGRFTAFDELALFSINFICRLLSRRDQQKGIDTSIAEGTAGPIAKRE